jgi:C-5 cytosine-specific DNA methylase
MRLQGFNDRYRVVGSNKSQRKQVGNAVPPPLAQKIAERIYEHIRSFGRKRAREDLDLGYEKRVKFEEIDDDDLY